MTRKQAKEDVLSACEQLNMASLARVGLADMVIEARPDSPLHHLGHPQELRANNWPRRRFYRK